VRSGSLSATPSLASPNALIRRSAPSTRPSPATMMAAGSVISDPDAQAAIWFLGALSRARVSGEQAGGAFALADHLVRRGNAVHVHDQDETFFVLDGELRVFAGEEEHRRVRHRRGAAQPPSPPLCRHVRHRAVPHPEQPRRVRAVRRRGRSARSGPHPAPATRRTSPRWPSRRPERHHDRGSTPPALEPGRALRSSTAVTAAPARPPQPTITKAVRGEVASSTGPPTR
jgi:hypothetical protein